MNGTNRTAGLTSTIVAVPLSVLISYATTAGTIKAKTEANEHDIKKLESKVDAATTQGVRNEERLISQKESLIEIKDLLREVIRNTEK